MLSTAKASSQTWRQSLATRRQTKQPTGTMRVRRAQPAASECRFKGCFRGCTETAGACSTSGGDGSRSAIPPDRASTPMRSVAASPNFRATRAPNSSMLPHLGLLNKESKARCANRSRVTPCAATRASALEHRLFSQGGERACADGRWAAGSGRVGKRAWCGRVGAVGGRECGGRRDTRPIARKDYR